jgi:hypothetical protein
VQAHISDDNLHISVSKLEGFAPINIQFRFGFRHKKLPKLTCTDIKQQWGRIAKKTAETYSFLRVGEFCDVKGIAQPEPVTTETVDSVNKSLLIEAGKRGQPFQPIGVFNYINIYTF